MHYKVRVGIEAITIALLIAAPAVVEAASGSASLTGRSSLAVRGCGAQRMQFSGTLLVQEDGTWTANGGDDTFAGTYVPAGRTGRRLVLTLDGPSEAALIASVEENVASVCDSPPATVTRSRAKVVALVINRKLMKAKLVVKYGFTGTAGGRSGTATYRLIGRGGWTPG
jgi:hypothetical protein